MPRATGNGSKAAAEDEDNGGEDVQEDDTPDTRQPALQLGSPPFPMGFAGTIAVRFPYGVVGEHG